VGNTSTGGWGIYAFTNQSFGLTDAPSLTATITGNTVSATDAAGIYARAVNSAATLRAKIQTNVVAAPGSGFDSGIRVDSGSSSGNTTVCLNISGNSSAPASPVYGIALRKQGTTSTTNTFGINGMSATGSPGVESYVDGLNPSDNGTVLSSATSGFSSC